jgi:hypothetical protein
LQHRHNSFIADCCNSHNKEGRVVAPSRGVVGVFPLGGSLMVCCLYVVQCSSSSSIHSASPSGAQGSVLTYL